MRYQFMEVNSGRNSGENTGRNSGKTQVETQVQTQVKTQVDNLAFTSVISQAVYPSITNPLSARYFFISPIMSSSQIITGEMCQQFTQSEKK